MHPFIKILIVFSFMELLARRFKRKSLTFPGGPGLERKNPRGGFRQGCFSDVIEFKVTLYISPGRI